MTDQPNKRNLYAVVGMQHQGKDVMALLRSLPNNHPVVLIRDPNNKWASNAVQVWVDDRMVGFVPKTQNAVLSKFIDDTGDLKTLPTPVVAIDAAMPVATTVTKSIRARLHWGGNEHPLVEV
jgi:hypothetical protein